METFIKKEFEDDVIRNYPTPIANTFWSLVSAESYLEGLHRILDIYRVNRNYLALISLKYWLDNEQKFENSDYVMALVSKLLWKKGLQEGEWIGLIRETTKPFRGESHYSLILQIRSLFWDTNTYDLKPDKEVFDKLNGLRLRKGHAVAETEEEAKTKYLEYVPYLKKLLILMSFVKEYQLVLPSKLGITDNNEYVHTVSLLMGTSPPGQRYKTQEILCNKRLNTNALYIRSINNEEESYSLDPLVVFAKCLTCNSKDVFLYNNKETYISYTDGQEYTSPKCKEWIKKKKEIRELSKTDKSDCRNTISFTSSLVGRDESIKKLEAALSRVNSGEGIIVLLKGSLGIGKTKLINHFIESNYREEVKILRGGFEKLDYEESLLLPYHGIRQTIEKIFGIKPTDRNKEIEDKIVKEIAEWKDGSEIVNFWVWFLSSEVDYTEIISERFEDARGKHFRMIASLYYQLARKYPLLVFLDDLQWADELSIKFLSFFKNSIKKSPARILFIGTYRPMGLKYNHFLEKAIADISREEEVYTDNELDRLSNQEIEEIINNIFSNLNTIAVESIVERADGNPFYAIQMLRYLHDQKAIQKRDNEWIVSDKAKLANMPDSIVKIVNERINKIATRREGQYVISVLMLASAIGRTFRFQLLENALAKEIIKDSAEISQNLEEYLEDINEAGLLSIIYDETIGDYWMEFDSRVIQEVVYNRLKRKLYLKKYHKSICMALIDLYGATAGSIAPNIARHCYIAGDMYNAYKYYKMAGDVAFGKFAYRDGFRYASMAMDLSLELNEEMSSAELSELYLLIGDIKRETGLIKESIDYYEKAQRNNKEANLKNRLLINHGLAHSYQTLGQYEKSQSISEESIAIAVKSNNTMTPIYLEHVQRYVHCLYLDGRHEEALAEIEKIIPDSRKKGLSIYGKSLLERGTIKKTQGNYSSALSDCLESLSIATEIKDLQTVINANQMLSDCYYSNECEDIAKAKMHAQEGLRIAEEINFRAKIYLPFNIAELARYEGEYEKALEMYMLGRDRAIKGCNANRIGHSYLGEAEVYRIKQEPKIELYQTALTYYPERAKVGIIHTLIGKSLALLLLEDREYENTLIEVMEMATKCKYENEIKLIERISREKNPNEIHKLIFT